jgi:hypothetical protein
MMKKTTKAYGVLRGVLIGYHVGVLLPYRARAYALMAYCTEHLYSIPRVYLNSLALTSHKAEDLGAPSRIQPLKEFTYPLR